MRSRTEIMNDALRLMRKKDEYQIRVLDIQRQVDFHTVPPEKEDAVIQEMEKINGELHQILEDMKNLAIEARQLKLSFNNFDLIQ